MHENAPGFLTHMFWAYGDLSQVERLCCNSFIAHGYDLQLWTYGEIGNAPAGLTLRDAREILPESRVFTYVNGSYAAFANLFRYAVLSRLGGLYADTDVVCLTPASRLGTEAFLVAERLPQQGALRINNNLIFCPRPMPGNIIDLAFAFTDRFPKDKLDWGDCGPKLLSMIAMNYPQTRFEIKDPEFANPISYWDCPALLLMPGLRLPEKTAFLHCYSEMWKRASVDKNSAFPRGSVMRQMADAYR